MDVLAQLVPLLVEEVLQVDIEVDIFLQLQRVLGDGLRLSQADGAVGPVQPALHLEVLLDRHVQGVVGQPALVLLQEGLHLFVVPAVAVFKSGAQDGKAAFVDLAVVHIAGVAAPVDALQIAPGQQVIFHQQIQVDEIGVSGEGGEALVGAVALAGGAQGQQLPVLLAGSVEKVSESVGLFSQGADAVVGGQGRDGHEDTAAAIHKHHSFLN